MKNRKILLTENEIPDKWYNIVADMPNKPLPPLHPGTKPSPSGSKILISLLHQKRRYERLPYLPRRKQLDIRMDENLTLQRYLD